MLQFTKPLCQSLGTPPSEYGFSAFTLDHDDVLRLEAIDKCCGLSGNNDLDLRGHGPYQSTNHGNGVGMESKLRLVQNQNVRQVLFGLKEKHDEGYDPQHAVRRLRNIELLVTVSFTPGKQQVTVLRFQFKIREEG